jgi:quercetin dioxygenase-like cupin family protein
MRTAAMGLGLSLVWASSAAAAPAAAPVIDNARVSVWDVTLARGETGPATPHGLDTVVMFLEGGRVRTATADGKARTVVHRFGDAVFIPRGADARDTVVAGGPVHEVVIALKDVKKPPVPNTSGLPLAFPRPGVIKALDNDRAVVWNYTWRPGKPTPRHFHDKEVVVAYRYDGALASVTPDGKRTVNHYKAGEIRFNPANRIHYELLEPGQKQSAVMMELK